MGKDDILAEIARYVDEDEYQDPQEMIDLLSAIRAYILACDAEACYYEGSIRSAIHGIQAETQN